VLEHATTTKTTTTTKASTSAAATAATTAAKATTGLATCIQAQENDQEPSVKKCMAKLPRLPHRPKFGHAQLLDLQMSITILS
jgi:hypothetical protein